MAVPLLFVFLISLITGHICVRYVRIRDVRVRYSRIYVMSVPFLFVFFFFFFLISVPMLKSASTMSTSVTVWMAYYSCPCVISMTIKNYFTD